MVAVACYLRYSTNILYLRVGSKNVFIILFMSLQICVDAWNRSLDTNLMKIIINKITNTNSVPYSQFLKYVPYYNLPNKRLTILDSLELLKAGTEHHASVYCIVYTRAP